MIVGTSPTIKINSDLFLAQVVSTPLEQLSSFGGLTLIST